MMAANLHRRTKRLIASTVERLGMDLQGLTVLTEAATGPFAVTPALALAGGAARVIAVARDGVHGTVADATDQVRTWIDAAARRDALEVITSLEAGTVGDADIVTNLGHVRPLTAPVVSWMKPTAVVALMCESWEVRVSDVDLEACRRQGIVVLGTNEHEPSLPIFDYCGPLALRLVLDAGFELAGTRIAVVGQDRFAPVVHDALRRAGASVTMAAELTRSAVLDATSDADVVFLAEYASDTILIGPDGVVPPDDLARSAPDAVVIQLCGGIDERSMRAAGLEVWPSPTVPPRRMSRTLAAIGARPVIELHAAGLLVGSIAARLRLGGATPEETLRQAPLVSAFVQPLTC